MISIIGLGKFCSVISNAFAKYPQYNIQTISTDKNKSANHFIIPIFKTAEEYEANVVSIDGLFKKVDKEVYIFLDGSEAISGIVLRMLENLKKNITIFYIKSDTDLMSDVEILQDKVTFNVLQQYARSGLFNAMYIIDKTKLEQIIGDIPITQYHDALASLVSSTVHMCNVYANTDTVMHNMTDSDIVNRILTIGIGDLSTGNIKWFYDLQNMNELIHYYAINKETLEKDQKLMQKIKKHMKDKQLENCKIMFGIYETSYSDNFLYCVARTKFIQQLAGT